MTLYRPLNAVEVNYQWKLHAENDLGVPLAPSAMNLAMYKKPDTTNPPPLHPDDAALLDWKGSMGDTAAEELQKSKDRARAAARLALAGKTIPTSPQTPQFQKKGSKKEFSRVLDDKMVFFMKKTTYLSNDYSRKVHDFTSLAEIKAREETQLKAKQQQFDRSAKAVEKTFSNFRLQHPKDKNLKPVWDYPLLPNVARWGDTFTHVVMDNPPKSMTRDVDALSQAFVAHVEQRSSSARMTCQLLIPDHQLADQENDELRLKSIAQYDLDVVPLKESEDAAHTNFSLWIDPEDQIVYFLPIPSRVQLSSGRPGKRVSTVSRRPLEEDEDYLERVAQVDMDVAKQLDAKNKDEFGVYEDDDDEDEKKEAGGQRKTTEIMDFDDDDED
jgi:RNA polymerase II-associated factor 1